MLNIISRWYRETDCLLKGYVLRESCHCFGAFFWPDRLQLSSAIFFSDENDDFKEHSVHAKFKIYF